MQNVEKRFFVIKFHCTFYIKESTEHTDLQQSKGELSVIANDGHYINREMVTHEIMRVVQNEHKDYGTVEFASLEISSVVELNEKDYTDWNMPLEDLVADKAGDLSKQSEESL